jgi:2-keto-3-deoxy-L-rhamnonate aldolase RhmA
MGNPFREQLDRRAERTPVGSWIMAASPLVAEAMGHAGFDWGVLDMEHTPLDLMDLVHMLQAVAGTRMSPIVRVPWNDTVMIKRVMDAGAQTLLIPFVQNADEARAAVAATRYPPTGVRGMAGMSRASRFGTAPQYFARAHEEVCVIVQLETPAAVAELEAIASVPGVDALFLGPADLSGSMGLVGQLTHPDVVALMADAARRARAMGKPIGTVGGTPEVVEQYRAAGCDFLGIASDLGLMMRAAQGAVQAVRGGLSGSASGAVSATPAPISQATLPSSNSGY